MTRRKRDTRAILRTIEQSEERSPLFWWMVEHHDDMVQASTGSRIRWAAFCAEAARKGLTDTRGRPPTERNARETWLQARKAVAAGRAKQEAAPPKPIYPSRTPKGWVPPGIAAAIAAGNPAIEGVRPVGTGAEASAGIALVTPPPPPPPVPPARAEGEVPFSRLADPDDPPEVHAAYAQLEKQFDKADWYLMAGSSKKRRRE